MREGITTALEIAGGIAVVAGVFVLLGLGAALVVGGLVTVAAAYLASLGGSE